tara:strand:- start:222 stop:917 length:696 start_codon:yes stop_codon:yes gene_type:complete
MENYTKIVNTIEGWFSWEHICPLLEIVNKNQKEGNILEIGVHHGKSFIPMTTLLRNNEIAVAVDVFEDQQFNYDGSGKGCSLKLKENIKKVYSTDEIFNKIKIIKNDSTKMDYNNFLDFTNGGKYRIISIDGCHTKSATLIDLRNAIKILSNDGIIILDDYFNKDWPGVKFGIDKFMEENNDYRLVYLAWNKFIICHRDNYTKYMELLVNLKGNIAQHYESRCWLGEVFKK